MKAIISELKNFFFITLGAVLLSFGVIVFLLPAQIATGGTPGMALIIHYITNLDISLAVAVINIPLIIAGIKFITPAFAIRTLLSISFISLCLAVYPSLFTFPEISDPLLSTLYGGICIGAGIGFTLKGQASSGGTIIIAKIISKYSKIRPAQAILVIDVIVVSIIAIIYNNIELTLWSLLSIYVSTKVIDKILSGSVSEKVVHIMCNDPINISIKINQELGRKVTFLNGHHSSEASSKKIMYVVVGSRDIEKLKAIITHHDRDALVIVIEASEIMGSSRLS